MVRHAHHERPVLSLFGVEGAVRPELVEGPVLSTAEGATGLVILLGALRETLNPISSLYS